LRLKWLAPQVLTIEQVDGLRGCAQAFEPDADQAPPRHQPEAVVLDLVNPVRPGRRLLWHLPSLTSNDELMPGCIAGESRDGEVGASCRLLWIGRKSRPFVISAMQFDETTPALLPGPYFFRNQLPHPFRKRAYEAYDSRPN